MKAQSSATSRFAAVALVTLGAIAGLAHAQQKASPSPGPAQQNVTTYYYASEDRMKGFVAVSIGSPGDVTVTRFDGVPVRVAAASKGGLMIDLGVLREESDKGAKSTGSTNKAHTIIKVPMDLASLSVTVGDNFSGSSLSSIAEFQDRHGNHLSVRAGGPMGGPGGSF